MSENFCTITLLGSHASASAPAADGVRGRSPRVRTEG